MVEDYDFLFKCCVLGDGGVGKTALTLRFSKGFFTEDYKMTIGVDFHVKTISVKTEQEELRAKLQIWDTGGQERFSSIRPMYYKGALGALLIFDLTSYESFEHLPNWIEEIRNNTNTEIPLLLVGNKSDLEDQRLMFQDEINDFTRKFNLYYMETSAKTGEGVGDCFYILACLMIGQGVPDKLIAENTIFKPGEVTITAIPSVSEPEVPRIEPLSAEPYQTEPSEPKLPPLEPASNFIEPDLPEINEEIPQEPTIPEAEISSTFESEQSSLVEETTEAFSVSSIEPENETSQYTPTMNPPPEPKIKPPISESLKKPPILEKPSQFSPIPTPPKQSGEDLYKPKIIPFSSKTPSPAPAPKEFQKPFMETPKQEVLDKKPPFVVPDRKEQGESPSSTMPFMNLPPSSSQTPEKSSKGSLTDTLIPPPTAPIISKKEKKKIAKQKKKEERERKLKEEQEKQQTLYSTMKKPPKEKVEVEAETQPRSSLFDTLTQKAVTLSAPKEAMFSPFGTEDKNPPKKESTLTIIPPKEDVEPIPSTFATLGNKKNELSEKSKKADIVICKQCGAILSKDYMFCNKCGNRL